MAEQGDFSGTGYTIAPGPHPAGSAEAFRDQPGDPTDVTDWTARTPELFTGDPTFGGQDADLAPALPPVVDASGRLAFPLADGADLTGLVPLGPQNLWWHWWVRPGGLITSTASVGDVVAATTTTRQVAAYTVGGALAWSAALDDVAVVPPLPVGPGALAVATVGGQVSVFEVGTGRLRWRRHLDHGVFNPLASDGRVLVTADAGPGVTAWDVATGERLWHDDGAGSPFGTALVVAQGTVIVAGSGTVTAYGRDDDARRWVRDAGLGLNTVIGVGEQLWLDVDHGLHVWSIADGADQWTMPGAVPAATAASHCDPPAVPGTAYGLIRRGRRLAAVDASGRILRGWALAGSTASEVAVSCTGASIVAATYSTDGGERLRVQRIAGRP